MFNKGTDNNKIPLFEVNFLFLLKVNFKQGNFIIICPFIGHLANFRAQLSFAACNFSQKFGGYPRGGEPGVAGTAGRGPQKDAARLPGCDAGRETAGTRQKDSSQNQGEKNA